MDVLDGLHDLGNFLTVISAGTRRLSRLTVDPELARLLADVTAAAHRASDIVSAMKRSTPLIGEVGRVDLVAFTQELQDSLRAVAGPRVELTVVTELESALVEADQRTLEHALYNLVSNARDAMEGVGTLEIAIQVVPAHGRDAIGNELARREYAAISVRDSGPGFNVASVPKLFEPFYTTKPAGTGLGLRQVADVARSLHGGIFVVSEPGAGATFTVVIPTEPAS